jgi:nitrogen regulatory protein P-II 1
MKMLEAIIKPFKLDEVKEALKELQVRGITVSEVNGSGRQGGHNEFLRGTEHNVNFTPKVRLELLLEDGQVNKVIHCIQESAKTGKIGDGKVFILPADEIVRVRTGEIGQSAL